MDEILKDLREKLADLNSHHVRINTTRDEIVRRRQVIVSDSEYSNGICLQPNDLGFEETLDYLMALSRRYLGEIQRIRDFIYVIEEALKEQTNGEVMKSNEQ